MVLQKQSLTKTSHPQPTYFAVRGGKTAEDDEFYSAPAHCCLKYWGEGQEKPSGIQSKNASH